MPKKAPTNKEEARNALIIAGIDAGMNSASIARTYGISPQRVSRIWRDYGPGDNLIARKRRNKDEVQLTHGE